jgi:hypothetical protein
MKYSLFLLLFLSFFFTKDFEVIEATYQKWSGGTPDSGTGTNYIVKMLAKSNHDKLQIDQLWVGDDFYKVEAYKQEEKSREKLFVKNDTILIKATKLIQPNSKGVMVEKKNYENISKPYDYKGSALIGFKLKGKRKYKEISTLKKLKYLAYP